MARELNCPKCIEENKGSDGFFPVYFKDNGTFQIINECGFCFVHGIIFTKSQGCKGVEK